jgi:hypothetical protein
MAHPAVAFYHRVISVYFHFPFDIGNFEIRHCRFPLPCFQQFGIAHPFQEFDAAFIPLVEAAPIDGHPCDLGHGMDLDALALKPSGLFNIKALSGLRQKIH